MKKKLFIFFFLLTIISNAQFSLGDIAFAAYNSETTTNLPAGTHDDSFTIVLLRDVTAGEDITFTERGWYASGGFRPGENTCTLTFGSNYDLGTQITISKSPFLAIDEYNLSAGTLTGSGLSLATGGDQIFAYNTDNEPTAGDETGFIAAIHMNGVWNAEATSSTTSTKPSVFTDGTNSIFISPEVDNARFSSPNCSSATDVPSLRSLLNDLTKWETDNSFGYEQVPPVCDFLSVLSIDEEVFLKKNVTLFPNPVQDKLIIKTPPSLSIKSIEVLGITGKSLLVNENRGELITSNLKSGVYFLNVTFEENSRQIVKKFVKL